MALALLIVVRARYNADMSAFLPAAPTAGQRLLLQQLRDGPASRLILIGIDGADRGSRARLSASLAQRLRRDPRFTLVTNGEPMGADGPFLFEHRYQLSEAVSAQRFSIAGLRSAIQATIDQLSTAEGSLLKSLLARDPTGETLQVVSQLDSSAQPQRLDGVWVSADAQRAVLLARTRAAGSDTDAQQAAIETIERDFADAAADATGGAYGARLLLSGPAVFAVSARATIEREAVRLSLLSTACIVLLLLFVYRSAAALLLGLLPVASGALVGVAAVALKFGTVHGITLGFGITLIGESVDYSIYLFVQTLGVAGRDPADAGWARSQWPIVRLGMLTSICGFASLLPSAFPGLAQLGVYTIAGLITAAAVTRYVLPQLLPQSLAIRDLQPLGWAIADTCRRLRRGRVWLGVLPLLALALLYAHRDTFWNRQLAALSPVSASALALDATLRADLGAPDVSDIVIVSGENVEAALQAAERVGAGLQPLVDAGVIAGFDTPARYLPSRATQRQRLEALPSSAELRARLPVALAGLPLHASRLEPFVQDVALARTAPLLTRAALEGTSMAAGVDALLLQSGPRASALLPLRASAIDAARVNAVMAAAAPAEGLLLDIGRESNLLYSSYLSAAARLSLEGLAAITLLLWVALRSIERVLRVLAPLLLAVLAVAAGLLASGHSLTLLHLIGLLLIVAVGSNYALFFDHNASSATPARVPLTLASLIIANATTVLGFGVLAFSSVPVLQALGMTVAPGALLALFFSAMLAREAGR